MTIRTDTSITCDSPVKAHGKLVACGEVVEAESQRDAERKAMDKGWEKVNHRHYCRKCSYAARDLGPDFA